jgi:hypothetical protein
MAQLCKPQRKVGTKCWGKICGPEQNSTENSQERFSFQNILEVLSV